uniref:YLPM1-like spectrin repeat domain-containing protein n=1 Tax=Plectus sambesii TaxID=2011161 RepID=A0A914XAP9_9BILA
MAYSAAAESFQSSSPASTSDCQQNDSLKDQQLELERQYHEHKAQFESWKEKNEKLLGTPSYKAYVAQFDQWEKEVDKRRKALKEKLRKSKLPEEQRSRPSSSGAFTSGAVSSATPPPSLDPEKALADMNPMAFMMGVMSMMMFDPLLMAANAAATVPPTESVAFGPIPEPQQAAYYDQKARDMAQRQQRTRRDVFEGPSLPPAPELGPDYGYAGRADIFGRRKGDYGPYDEMWGRWGQRAQPAGHKAPFRPPQPGDILPPGWVTGQPIRREYRPPPPVKDYQQPSKLPFRDFSVN